MEIPVQATTINKRKIGRVLHLPYNPAGQVTNQILALRKLGLDVDYCIYQNYFLNYPTPGSLDVPKDLKQFFFESIDKYDIFHFHGGQTFFGWDNHSDLALLKRENKTLIMTFWGSEVRLLSKAKVNNPWAQAKILDENWIQKNLKIFAKYIDVVTVGDFELYDYIKDYFKRVYLIKGCIDFTNIEPYYPPKDKRSPLIIHAPTAPQLKGTPFIREAIENLKDKLQFEYEEIQNLSNEKALEKYKKADIIVDQLCIGTHGIFAIEAMMLGKPVITYIRDDLINTFPSDLPLIIANPANFKDKLKVVIENAPLRNEIGIKGREYGLKHHDPELIARQLITIYEQERREVIITPKKDPTVCLNMIVKNESEVIERCLTSLKPHIDYWVIADTGSTDDTKEKILKIMEGIPGELIDVPWKNFSHNRTAVLNTAKGKADYHLIIDADETFNPQPDYKKELKADCISGKIRYISGFEFNRAMFLRDECNWEYRGVVHNYAYSNSEVPITSDVITSCEIVHYCDGSSHKDSRNKYLRNARILENELQKNPKDTRSAFYLAESYRDAGEKEKAIKAYQHRIELGGWQEEVYWSYYQIALLSTDLDHYFAAYEYRPTRIESLFVVSILFYRANKLFSAKLILESIVNYPIPDDRLFLDTSIYIWKIKDQLALVYYKLGMFEAAKNIYEALVSKYAPESQHERIKNNIKCCDKQLEEKTQTTSN